jgi:hypothetical protein
MAFHNAPVAQPGGVWKTTSLNSYNNNNNTKFQMSQRSKSKFKKDRTNQVASTKVEREAAEIASTAGRMERITKAGAKHNNANRATSKTANGNATGGPKQLLDLLGSEEIQEIAWTMCVADCEEVVARIPTSQSTGIVPVDMYRKTEWSLATTNADRTCFAMFTDDCWGNDVGGNNHGILHANGGSSVYGNNTDSSFVGFTTPAAALANPTGSTSLLLGDVSEDFVSNAAVGTEYIQVAALHSVSAYLPPGATADTHFVGRAYCFQTLDAEREPLNNRTIATLRSLATEQDSVILCAEFEVTPGGTFLPVGFVGPRSEGGDDGFTELAMAALPLSNDAYEWRRIGDVPLNAPANVVTAKHMFALVAPLNTTFQIRTTYVWQTEMYATNKVQQGFSWLFHHVGMAGSFAQNIGSHLPGAKPVLAPRRLASSDRRVGKNTSPLALIAKDVPVKHPSRASTIFGAYSHLGTLSSSADNVRRFGAYNAAKVQARLAALKQSGYPIQVSDTGELLAPTEPIPMKHKSVPPPSGALVNLQKIGAARLGRGIKARHAVASVVSQAMAAPGVRALANSAPGGLSNVVDCPALERLLKKAGTDSLDMVLENDDASESNGAPGSWLGKAAGTVTDFLSGIAPMLPALLGALI